MQTSNSSIHDLRLTVVICTYNGAIRLPATLQALARSSLDARCWNVLVVDNASTDGTAQITRENWLRADVPLEVKLESTPGLMHARKCGVLHATGDVVVFVDDDNHLEAGFLPLVRDAFARDPQIEIFGGRGIARFEKIPPPWVGENPSYLAVGPQAGTTGYANRGFVYGAGSAFRRFRLHAIYTEAHLLTCVDRKGTALSAGGDVEVCYLATAGGGKIYYDHDAVFDHCIESRRLEWGAMCRLFEGFGQAHAWLGVLGRQARRSDGPWAELRASAVYTVIHAALCRVWIWLFGWRDISRMPRTARTLSFIRFTTMCRDISREKSMLAQRRKALFLLAHFARP